MAKPIHLKIDEPCSESWEGMTPDGKGRHCAACSKVVVDFSTMSDAELLAYFRKPKENTCGRFHTDQLGRPLMTPKRSFPGLRHFLTIALPALLFSWRASAQMGKVRITAASTTQHPSPAGNTAPKGINGVVRDSLGQAVPFATITFADGSSVAADANGRFFTTSAARTHAQVSAIGFHTTDATLDDGMEVILKNNSTEMDEVVIATINCYRRTEYSMGAVSRIRMDAINLDDAAGTTPLLTLYPNPVAGGNPLHIKANLAAGACDVRLFTMGGQLVHAEKLTLQGPNGKPAALQVPKLPAGIYLLQLAPEKDGNPLTQRVVITY